MYAEQKFEGDHLMGQFEMWLAERRHESDEVAVKSYYMANGVLTVEYTIERVLREVGRKAVRT